MDGEPWGIALVPTDEGEGLDRELLAMGRLGSRPPCVKRAGSVDPVWSAYAIPTLTTDYGAVLALPLWWDVALVFEGWDRARRVAFDAAGLSGGPELAAVLDAVDVMYPSAAGVLALARAMEAAGLCRVLVLVDGAVERAPEVPHG